jgi:hypothetical protein
LAVFWSFAEYINLSAISTINSFSLKLKRKEKTWGGEM